MNGGIFLVNKGGNSCSGRRASKAYSGYGCLIDPSIGVVGCNSKRVSLLYDPLGELRALARAKLPSLRIGLNGSRILIRVARIG
jgi:hypothetical protein